MPRHGKPIYEVKADGQVRWKVFVSVTRRGQRKQITKTFDNYEDAETFFAQSRLGDIVPRTRDTFDAWADRWLERKRAAGLRPQTLGGYASDLAHPRDAFGGDRIQEITEEQVESLVSRLAGEGRSRRMTGKMLGTLRSVFQLALRKNVIKVNPAAAVEALGRPARARDALTTVELEKLRHAIAGDPWEACWMLTLAGLRRSELLALRWPDFDLETGSLSITKARPIVGGEQGTKTARGARVLPLDAERQQLLLQLRERQVEYYGEEFVDAGYICVNEFGRPMRPEDWSRRWRALCVGTEGVRDNHTLHAARHSTVTFMRNAGVPDHIVAAWHGHDEVVMRQTYSHAHIDQLKHASASLSFGDSTHQTGS
jgi:integrase